jgi:hypothetical protein
MTVNPIERGSPAGIPLEHRQKPLGDLNLPLFVFRELIEVGELSDRR